MQPTMVADDSRSVSKASAEAANLRRRAVEAETRANRAKVIDCMNKFPDSIGHLVRTLQDLGGFVRSDATSAEAVMPKSKHAAAMASRKVAKFSFR